MSTRLRALVHAWAMASYALIYGMTGVRYDAVTGTYSSVQDQGRFSQLPGCCFRVRHRRDRDGEPFYEVHEGSIEVDTIVYEPQS